MSISYELFDKKNGRAVPLNPDGVDNVDGKPFFTSDQIAGALKPHEDWCYAWDGTHYHMDKIVDLEASDGRDGLNDVRWIVRPSGVEQRCSRCHGTNFHFVRCALICACGALIGGF